MLLVPLLGCERGCARRWVGEQGAGKGPLQSQGGAPMRATDCPDGLARCTGGVVEGSRLTSIQLPCKGGAEPCTCPWDRLGECERGCVVDGADAVAERGKAMQQLCAPPPGAPPVATPLRTPAPGDCDEQELYRCAGGAVVSCAEHAVVGTCVRGCFAEGASVGGEAAVGREAAFAILCTR